MNRRAVHVVSVLLLCVVACEARAQCRDQLCRNLQNIMDSAMADFRVYRADPSEVPDVSMEGTKVPCQMSTWANNVPMYICYAQVPLADGQRWYARTLQALQELNPSWRFRINSPGQDHYVDAGPENCEVPPTEGPYIGQCPVHLQAAKQNDGSAKLYLIVNSLTSPYLLHHIATAPAKAAPAVAAAGSGCDEFCQNLKKAFESRGNDFEDLRANKATGATTPATIKLGGAQECDVDAAPASRSGAAGTQYVCYWHEASGSAAVARFHDVVARLQVLIPSNWATHQGNEMEDSTGADMTAWYATEPGGKHELRVYLSGDSVGLHITASK